MDDEMSGLLYEIPNFERKYVVAQSAKTKGPLPWVAVPTKHDGLSFRRLMRRKDGCELYGVWILLIAIAGKCDRKGVLADGDTPLTAEDIALKTGADEKVISRALEVFSSKEIAWLATTALPTHSQDDTNTLPPHDDNATPTVRYGTVRNDTVRNERTPAADAASAPEGFEEFYEAYPRKTGRLKAEVQWHKAKKKADPAAIIAAARLFADSDVGKSGEFCPHPSTWLYQGRWADDPATWKRSAPPTGPTPRPRSTEPLDMSAVFALEQQRTEAAR